MAVALHLLGIEHKGKAFHCPNAAGHHNGDKRPSAGFFGDGTRWRCQGCGAGGSAWDLVMVAKGITFREARRFLAGDKAAPLRGEPCNGGKGTPKATERHSDARLEQKCRSCTSASTADPVASPRQWPVLRDGTPAELAALAAARGWRPDVLAFCQRWGVLRFGTAAGAAFWAVTDATARAVEARRLDGRRWRGDRKARAFPGSRKDWPIGLATGTSMDKCGTLLLVEGPPDWVAAVHLLIEARELHILPVCVLGAGCVIGSDALAAVARRPCIVWGQPDEAGRAAAQKWGVALRDAGSLVSAWIPYRDGDIDDWYRTAPPPADIRRCLSVKGGEA